MKIEEDLMFLTNEFNLKFTTQSFSNDVSGTFFGPMKTYSYYNSNGCFTIYHSVQRAEWDYYSSKCFSEKQDKLLENNLNVIVFNSLRESRKKISNIFKSESKLLAKIIKSEIVRNGEFFGIKVK